MDRIALIMVISLPLAFFAMKIIQKLLQKSNILKATLSRAKVMDKRTCTVYVRNAPNILYYVTFLYMIENQWHEREFGVSKKIYNSLYVDQEGILKHDYTEFIDFEKFKNK